MKKRIGYLFYILSLALVLMILITAAQILARRNIDGLIKGNREAAITFTVNNRLQDLINLSFELESKISSTAKPVSYRQSLLDSLTVLGYNTSVLKEVDLNKESTEKFGQLSKLTNRQITLSTQAIQFIKDGKIIESKKRIDSLRSLKLTDSVYSTAMMIEKYLEKDLQATFSNNTKVSSRLSEYNTVLAIIAIGAILILGTIIINRHIRQMQLIADLERSKTQAQQLAKIKDQFLANMSHEIRTPLNAIKGFTKILSQSTLDKEQQQHVNIITDASNNLIYIVNDILDISKIEAGKLRIEEKEFNLEKVLQTVEYLFLNTATEKELRYTQQINDDVPEQLKGDADRLMQIITNLVSNAIKFTNAGSVSTTVSKIKEDADNVWIKFCVEDTGDGIPENMQETIFQRFEQLNGNNITKGTGLGLSIVKSLTELMHGNINVSSELGKGSKFNVVLPFIKIVEQENVPANIETQEQFPHFENSSVLIVEDNKVNQLLLEHMLKKSGIIADIAVNGSNALELVKKKKYDLIFLDIQMPVMDGYETIHQLRNVMDISVPVLAMTAYALPGEEEKCLRSGMNGYLSKPVDFPKMFSLLKKYLQTKNISVKKQGVIKPEQNDFLLELAGGDKDIAKKVLQEIINEIPNAIKKLRNAKENKDANGLSGTLHHLVSTFSPLGADTPVMKKIQYLRGIHDIGDNKKDFSAIDDLIKEIDELNSTLTTTMEYSFK
jgi:signal transduction histidine kinase/CheY-like chemotaxis protein